MRPLPSFLPIRGLEAPNPRTKHFRLEMPRELSRVKAGDAVALSQVAPGESLGGRSPGQVIGSGDLICVWWVEPCPLKIQVLRSQPTVPLNVM